MNHIHLENNILFDRIDHQLGKKPCVNTANYGGY